MGKTENELRKSYWHARKPQQEMPFGNKWRMHEFNYLYGKGVMENEAEMVRSMEEDALGMFLAEHPEQLVYIHGHRIKSLEPYNIAHILKHQPQLFDRLARPSYGVEVFNDTQEGRTISSSSMMELLIAQPQLVEKFNIPKYRDNLRDMRSPHIGVLLGEQPELAKYFPQFFKHGAFGSIFILLEKRPEFINLFLEGNLGYRWWSRKLTNERHYKLYIEMIEKHPEFEELLLKQAPED